MVSLPSPGSRTFLDKLLGNLWGQSARIREDTLIPVNDRNDQRRLGIRNPYHSLTTSEVPLRDVKLAKQLIEMYEHSTEVNRCLNLLTQTIYSDASGGDSGPWVSKKWGRIDPVTKERENDVHPDVYAIVTELLTARQENGFILGGDSTILNCRQAPIYGDSFLNLTIGREGFGGPNDWGIVRSQPLLTWHTEHVTDINGRTEYYVYYPDDYIGSSGYKIHPATLIHFCWHREGDYGRSLWKHSRQDWDNIKESHFDVRHATREAAFSPLVHELPASAGVRTEQTAAGTIKKDDKAEYQLSLYNERLQGILTDLTVWNGHRVYRPANPPDPRRIVGSDQYWRRRLIPAGFAPWNFPDLYPNAKELQGQNAITQTQLVTAVENTMSEGFRQAADLQIILRRGWDFWLEHGAGKYMFTWPALKLRAMDVEKQHEDEEQAAADDTEEPDNSSESVRLPVLNGHRR